MLLIALVLIGEVYQFLAILNLQNVALRTISWITLLRVEIKEQDEDFVYANAGFEKKEVKLIIADQLWNALDSVVDAKFFKAHLYQT